MLAGTRAITLSLVFALICGGWAAAQTPATPSASGRNEVTRQLSQVRTWLGQGENAERWDRFLRLDQLDQQLGQPQPDRQVVARVLSRFYRDAAGLDRPRFVQLRDAIARWLRELPPLSEQQLAEAAISAHDDFAPVSAAQLEQARAEVRAATTALDGYLARGPEANAQRWREYLLWQPMLELLEQSQPRAELIRAVARAYFTNVTGMERPQFQRVREALNRYAGLLEVTDAEAQRGVFRRTFVGQADEYPALLQAETPEAQYEAMLEVLSGQLAQYRETRSTDDAWRIGRLVGLLDQAGRARELVAGVRNHFWHPNLHLRLSQRLVSAGIADRVVERTPVNENILGTSVHGSAVLNGHLQVQLVPSNDVAQLNLVLSGIAHSNTVGYNRGVQIFSTGVSQIGASKPLLIDENGLRSTAAVARVCTNTTINCISAKLRIIERIAWKRAMQTKPAAEQVAARRTEFRTSNRMDTQARPLVADANRRFEEEFRTPLDRVGAFPRLLRLATTRDALLVRATTVTHDQLAAPGAPPPISNPRDMAAQIHESLAANFSEAAIGGQTMRNTRLAQLHEQLTGTVPDELAITEETELWSIRFSPDRPIRTHFSEGQVAIALHADEFVRFGQTYDEVSDVTRENIIISARYTMEQTPEGPVLSRQDLSVDFPAAPRPIGIRRIGIRSFLGRKFDSVFKERIDLEGFQLPGRWEDAGTLRVQSMDSRNGWLLLTWELFPNAVPTAPTVAATDAR